MELVVVGLPGSGKTAVGRRVAGRHGAVFVDLDDAIERAAGMRVPEIFEQEGEAGFRARERAAITALGAVDTSPALTRVIAPGGGAIVDPRNRWRLFRGRRVAWLDARPEVVAQRLRRSPTVRPLVAGRDPMGVVRDLAAARKRFYAVGEQVSAVAEMANVVAAVDALVREARDDVGSGDAGTVLLRAETVSGRLVLGAGILRRELAAALREAGARRAILVSEPGAWDAVGGAVAHGLAADGWSVERLLLPQGEDAKRLPVVEDAARRLARLRVERGEPIVAIGGGALGDTAGFLAATYLRGVPIIQVPTTLVAQLDSSIGGKTGVDLPEGKNLVGAFHQPAAIVIDVEVLRTLPERDRRAALAEAVKMATLGDDRLFELLEQAGPAIARGDAAAFDDGSVAEAVERAAWAKVDVVTRDEREANVRISLNLGHSLGHAIEAAAGFGGLLHGEAVGYGLRAAARIGVAREVTPPARAERIERALDSIGLGVEPLALELDAVLDLLEADKKHADGRLRWVLPTDQGWTLDDGVPLDLVREVAATILAGRGSSRVPRGTAGAATGG